MGSPALADRHGRCRLWGLRPATASPRRSPRTTDLGDGGPRYIEIVRLLLAHWAQVAATRGDEMQERPDSDDAVARVRAVLDAIRARRAELGE